jgi:hypothetical protein
MAGVKKRKLNQILNLGKWGIKANKKKKEAEEENVSHFCHRMKVPRTWRYGTFLNLMDDFIDLGHIHDHRYARRSRRFIDAYAHGLNGKQAAWASHRYHGHRALPETLINDLLKANV